MSSPKPTSNIFLARALCVLPFCTRTTICFPSCSRFVHFPKRRKFLLCVLDAYGAEIIIINPKKQKKQQIEDRTENQESKAIKHKDRKKSAFSDIREFCGTTVLTISTRSVEVFCTFLAIRALFAASDAFVARSRGL